MEIAAPPQILLDSKFTEFNIREDVGLPHFVRLHDKATKRFERQVRAFGSSPGAGSRAGGILLGSIEVTDQCFINVQDFTPVLCEHRRDGRNSFLDCPAQCFRNAIRRANENARKNQTIVGYYRSSPGPAFALEKEDHDLFKKYFAQNFRFLLLVKPSNLGYATAVFYLGLEGQLQPGRSSVEFPLSLKELGGEEPPEVDEPAKAVVIPAAVSFVEPQAAPVPVPAPEPAPAPMAAPAPAVPTQKVEELVQQSRRSEQFWKGAAAAAILLGSVFAVRSIMNTNRPEAPAIPPQAPAVSAPQPATPVVEASKPKAIPEPEPVAKVEQPRPAAPVTPPPAVVPEPVKASARKFNPPAPKPTAPANALLSAPPELAPSRTAAPLPASTLPAPAIPVAQAPVVVTPPPPVVPRQETPAPAAPKPTPPAPTPAAQGPLKAARVVRQAAPVVPDQIKRKIRGEVVVAVRVDLDSSGKVIEAVPVSKATKVTELAGLAVEAARQSQFEPATRGDQKVAGQATLQFHFEGEVIRLPVQPSIR